MFRAFIISKSKCVPQNDTVVLRVVFFLSPDPSFLKNSRPGRRCQKQYCGSGSFCFWTFTIRIRNYLFGSGSFHHQANCCFVTLWLFIVKDWWTCRVPLKSNKQKDVEKNVFLLSSWRSLTKRAGSGSGAGSVRGSGSVLYTTDPHSTTMGKNIQETSTSCSRARVLLLGYILAGWLRLHYQIGDQVLRIGLHHNNKMS